jgi:hypothetical protein
VVLYSNKKVKQLAPCGNISAELPLLSHICEFRLKNNAFEALKMYFNGLNWAILGG